MDELKVKSDYRDEISLVDLMKIFWQQKYSILIIMLFCFGLSVVYLFLAKNVYEAKVSIIAPTAKDLFILNAARSDRNAPLVANFMVNDVYGIFGNFLTLDAIEQEFFTQVYLPSLTDKQRLIPKDKLFHACFKNILIKADVHVSPIKYTITIDADNPAKAREWVSQYIALVEKKSVALVAQLIKVQNTTLINNIRKEIDEIKEYETNIRSTKLAQLKESLIDAKTKGIYDVSFNITPNDDLGLKLQKLKNEYDFYTNMSIPFEKIKVFRLDGVVHSSDTPISPKGPFILMLGLFTGLILGCIIGLIRNSFLRKNINVL